MALKVRKGKPPQGDINVTPLIDVVLVLLIIFMVLVPIIIQEMAVNLPDKTETVDREDMPKDQIVVAVCEDGSFSLNRRIMEPAELKDRARLKLRSKSSKVVFVDAHPDAPYDRVVLLMDAAREAGADKLGMTSLKTAEEFTACTPSAEAAPAVDGQPEGAVAPG